MKWPDQQESPDESIDDCDDSKDGRTTAASDTEFHERVPIIAFRHTHFSSEVCIYIPSNLMSISLFFQFYTMMLPGFSWISLS